MNSKELLQQHRALGNKKRLAILSFLKRNKSVHVTEIASGIRLSLRSTSKHLQVLYKAGFLETDKRYVYVYYRITLNQSKILKTTLAEL